MCHLAPSGPIGPHIVLLSSAQDSPPRAAGTSPLHLAPSQDWRPGMPPPRTGVSGGRFLCNGGKKSPDIFPFPLSHYSHTFLVGNAITIRLEWLKPAPQRDPGVLLHNYLTYSRFLVPKATLVVWRQNGNMSVNFPETLAARGFQRS